MSKQVLVVFGATGNQGGSVIETILADPVTAARYDVVGVTRDPSKLAAVSLADKGVKVVKASLDDKDSLREVLNSANAVFAVTNAGEAKREQEIQQGKNVVDVAKECNVQHFIWSSANSIAKISNGKYTKVDHFDAKAVVDDHIRSIGLPATYLHLGAFMEFMLHYVHAAPDGKSYTWTMPMDATTTFPLVSPAHDTGRFVKHILLNREEFLGRVVRAAENEYGAKDIVDTLRDAGGLNISIPEDISEETMLEALSSRGASEAFKESIVENARFFNEFGYYGGQPIDRILSEPLQSLRDYVAGSQQVSALRKASQG